ncbi:MAG: RluA family pseudouridine synthase [Actinomycetota bacterium]|nr:RluA family pseudouridine synthase [Actinomycetota bacterium]
MTEPLSAIAGIDDEGLRLDIFLANCPGVISRSQAQQMIETGKARVANAVRPKNHHLKIGDIVTYEVPAPPATVEPEQIDLRIVYEDDALLVIDKPAGMVVHPGAGNHNGTLVNAALAHTKLANVGAPLRPGIVHRLDKGTSGLMVVAKTDQAYMALVEQIKERRVSRKYLTLVRGDFGEPGGRIEAPIRRSAKDRKIMTVGVSGGKEAVTNFRVLATAANYSLVEVALETGRTHQIRVHFKFINHPVIGDPVYGATGSGGPLDLTRQFLHAYRLEFYHPVTGERMAFSIDLPADLKQALDKIEGLSLKLPKQGQRD